MAKTTKKLTAKQIAARKKFAAMAKARAKAAKAKKPAAKKTATKKATGTYQTGSSNKLYDSMKKAQGPGKRVSATGGVYYERRKNRSDMPGSILGIGSNIYVIRDNIEKELKKAVEALEILKTRKKNKELTDPFHIKLLNRYPLYIKSLKKQLREQNKLINQNLK